MKCNLNVNKSIVNFDNKFYINLVIKIIEFFLYYIRNSFLVSASLFIFIPLVIILIYYQDTLNLHPIGIVFSYLDNVPIIGNMIDISESDADLDEGDLGYIFLKISFYLTIFTEIFRYIKIYVFKKKDKMDWKSLLFRIIFVIVGITIIDSFAGIYIALNTDTSGDSNTVINFIIFIIFWLISSASAIVFLFIDFIAKNFHKIITSIKNHIKNSSKQPSKVIVLHSKK